MHYTWDGVGSTFSHLILLAPPPEAACEMWNFSRGTRVRISGFSRFFGGRTQAKMAKFFAHRCARHAQPARCLCLIALGELDSTSIQFSFHLLDHPALQTRYFAT